MLGEPFNYFRNKRSKIPSVDWGTHELKVTEPSGNTCRSNALAMARYEQQRENTDTTDGCLNLIVGDIGFSHLIDYKKFNGAPGKI